MELRDGSSQPPATLVNDLNEPPSSVTALIQNITSSMSVFGYNDEYDPSRPNDYEKLKEQQTPVKPKSLYDDVENDDEADRDDEPDDEPKDQPVRKGNVFAPPPSLIEEDKRANESGATSVDLSSNEDLPSSNEQRAASKKWKSKRTTRIPVSARRKGSFESTIFVAGRFDFLLSTHVSARPPWRK